MCDRALLLIKKKRILLNYYYSTYKLNVFFLDMKLSMFFLTLGWNAKLAAHPLAEPNTSKYVINYKYNK